jgi:hypothetical protein
MAKITLYTSDYPSYEQFKEYCIECEYMTEKEIPAENSQEFTCWSNNEQQAEWEDFIAALKEYADKQKGDGFMITGSLGLWDGRRNIYPTFVKTLRAAVEKCVDRGDYIKIEFDKKLHVIEVAVTHHDGTNLFTIQEIKNYDAAANGCKKPIKVAIREL